MLITFSKGKISRFYSTLLLMILSHHVLAVTFYSFGAYVIFITQEIIKSRSASRTFGLVKRVLKTFAIGFSFQFLNKQVQDNYYGFDSRAKSRLPL